MTERTITTEEQIVDFIKRRFPVDNNWTTGNCYWFAEVLCWRVDDLSIYYAPIEGHFVAGDGLSFYDYTGKYKPEEQLIEFCRIKYLDPLWYERIIRDCID